MRNALLHCGAAGYYIIDLALFNATQKTFKQKLLWFFKRLLKS